MLLATMVILSLTSAFVASAAMVVDTPFANTPMPIALMAIASMASAASSPPPGGRASHKYKFDSFASRETTMAEDPPPFPPFKDGQVFTRPDDFQLEVGIDADVSVPYTRAAYQFGTSTRPDMCQPAKIIYAETEEDVKKAVKYAYDAKIALALRSGGHNYQSYSSTNGKNMQLDVSKLNKIEQDQGDETIWTVGAGCKLRDFDAKLREKGMFVPHGECTAVAVGGHIQTGGFSPSFSRSFGLFVDHAIQFTIVLAPEVPGGEPVTKVVDKPKVGVTDELWYTVLGGSPGNFGVITEAKFKVLKDIDHKHSRAQWFTFLYDPANKGPNKPREEFERLMKIACEYSDDENLPRDYCFNVYMINHTPEKEEDMERFQNIDVKMSVEYPTDYGDRAPALPCWIGLSVVWLNCDGDACKFTDQHDEYGYSAEQVFEEVADKVRGGVENNPGDELLQWFLDNFKDNFRSHIEIDAKSITHPREFNRVLATLTLDGTQDVPVSQLIDRTSFPARISPTPCLGATLLGFSNELSKDKHALSKWTAKIEDQGHWTEGVFPDSQWTFFGNKHSKMRPEHCGNNNVLAFRRTTLCFLNYFHYNDVFDNEDVDAPFDMTSRHVDQVVEGLAGKDGKSGFFGCDRRWMAFLNQDENLDDLWEKYFNNRCDYLRVLKKKREVDPTDVFTPNLFCVGASRKYGTPEPGSPSAMTVEELNMELERCSESEAGNKRKRVEDLAP